MSRHGVRFRRNVPAHHPGAKGTKIEMARHICAALLFSRLVLFAQAPAAEHDAAELAKKTQNPVGDIVSLPFQFNFNGGGALKDQASFNLNIQPVFPIHISPAVTLISRTIIPIDSFPGTNGIRYSGTGDIQEQTFLTPAKPGRLIWGIGPSFSFPTATALPARTGTWAAGGSLVVVGMPGRWVVGSLFSQLSPLTDSNGPPRTNTFVWQYFVNCNFGKGWAIVTAPSITANWDAVSAQRWTVPVGLGISRTLVFNRQPMTLGFQYYKNVEKPNDAPGTLVRFSISFIFPQGPAGR